MNLFTLPASSPEVAGLGLGADFRRTATPPWPVATPAGSVLGNMAQLSAAPIRGAAQGWGAIFQALPYKGGDARPGAVELPAQAGWVRLTGTALGKSEDLQKKVNVTGAHLVDLSDRDPVLRAIAQWAGQAKDGAMDLRAANAAFGSFCVTVVLDGLQRRVRELPREEGQRLLGKFAPMLVLIVQAQADQQASRARLAGKRQDARAEAEAAALEARRAEVLRAYHAGEDVSRADLLELALSTTWSDEAPAPEASAALTAPAARPAARERRKKPR